MAKKKAEDVLIIADDEVVEYVIYCRKSNDESSNKQVESIPRQIDICVKYAEANNLLIKKKPKNFPFEKANEIAKEDSNSDLNDRKIFQETRDLYIIKEQGSAKKPHERPKWNKLIEMIGAGKIRGVLSYSPDRQARNMVDGGEIMNFADEGIVDLKYTNFYFEPTASGKMMLGIWFVFSKQYSDKLAEDVISGNRRKLEKLETLGQIKHGYKRGKDKKWEPDGERFELMRRAFQYRIVEKWSNEKIVNWLNKNGYYRLIKKSETKLPMTKSTLNRVWTDPFYYGVWIRNNETIDLRTEENSSYVPMITYAEHEILCDRYKNQHQTLNKVNKNDDLASLRMVDNDFVIYEDEHGRKMNFTLALPNKKNRHHPELLELRKTKPEAEYGDFIKPERINLRCEKMKMGISMRDVYDLIYDKISQIHITEDDYFAYLKYAKDRIEIEFMEIDEDRRRYQLRINEKRSEKNKYVENNLLNLGNMDDAEKKIYEDHKKELANDIEFYEEEIKNLNSKEELLIFDIETVAKFMKDAGKYFACASYVQKKSIIKILFLNILVDKEKRLKLVVNPDAEGLFVQVGGPTWT